ncbi:hypothetical protein HDV05_006622, partial [Chytridiales sp. JEL 0842]
MSAPVESPEVSTTLIDSTLPTDMPTTEIVPTATATAPTTTTTLAAASTPTSTSFFFVCGTGYKVCQNKCVLEKETCCGDRDTEYSCPSSFTCGVASLDNLAAPHLSANACCPSGTPLINNICAGGRTGSAAIAGTQITEQQANQIVKGLATWAIAVLAIGS